MKVIMAVVSPIIFITILSFCKSGDISEYPDTISDNNLEHKYDSAKWIVYSSNYNSEGVVFESIGTTYKDTSLNIISCSLNLDKLIIKGDTIEMSFYFYINDTNERCYPYQAIYKTRVLFIDNDSIIYRIYADFDYNNEVLEAQRYLEVNALKENSQGYRYYSLKEEESLFPEFLRKTNHKLNPWLKQEAIKRGILFKEDR